MRLEHVDEGYSSVNRLAQSIYLQHYPHKVTECGVLNPFLKDCVVFLLSGSELVLPKVVFISWTNDSFFGDLQRKAANQFWSDNRSLVRFRRHTTTPAQTGLLKNEETPETLNPVTNASSSSRPPYCQPDPANEFCLTLPAPRVAAWHWSLSGLGGQRACEMPSVVPLCSPTPTPSHRPTPHAQTQQGRKPQ